MWVTNEHNNNFQFWFYFFGWAYAYDVKKVQEIHLPDTLNWKQEHIIG